MAKDLILENYLYNYAVSMLIEKHTIMRLMIRQKYNYRYLKYNK